MGFKVNDNHSDDFDLCVRTKVHPYIAPKIQTDVQVPGRDGRVFFEDGYDNLVIEFECTITNRDRFARRKTIRSIASWLTIQNGSKLVIDHEDDVEYDVVTIVNNVTSESKDPQLPVEVFTVKFTCKPQAYSREIDLEVGLKWENAFVNWEDADFDWKGDVPLLEPVDGDILSIINSGTYKALPIIKITGICGQLTIGEFTLSSLSGTIYIDTENQLVYSLVNNGKFNELSRFSGKFPELKPGINLFPVSGSITNLALHFMFRHTYL